MNQSPLEDRGESEELELSPSERMGDRAASKISGERSGRSTVKALASIVLGFELVVVFLAGLTVFGLRAIDPPELGIIGGLGLCAVIVIALATMRRGKLGLWIGWAVHALFFLAGVILPAIVFVALIFAALWIFCIVKGTQIDREREQFIAA